MKICPCCGFVEIPAKSATDVLQKVCDYFSLTPTDMISKIKKRHLVNARMIFAILMLEKGMKEKQIGELLKRDRTTVIHYKDLFSDLMFSDQEIKNIYQNLKQSVYGIN